MSTNNEHSHHFIVPLKYYVGTIIALLFLTLVTVWTAQYDFGFFNIILALIIASTKAILVLMFFMGLRWDKGFNLLGFVATIMFLFLFIVFCMLDIATRSKTDPLESEKHSINSPVKIVDSYQKH